MAILISTPQDLHNIRNNLSGDYEIVNDIDMSGWGNFEPIGNSSNPFKGLVNGKGYKVINLTINTSNSDVGLFGYIDNATVSNVAVENGNVISKDNSRVGVLIGSSKNNSLISNCYTNGSVEGKYGVGGLMGWDYSGNVENCYSHAKVKSMGRAGGLIGHRASPTDEVRNSYSIGLVTVQPDPNNYNGGLIGSYELKVLNSYYDIQTTGQTISAGGEGKTTSEMKTQSTYSGWDFTSTWGMNGDYPYLQVFGVPQAPAKVEIVNVQSHLFGINSTISLSKVAAKQLTTYSQPLHSVLNRKLSTSRNVEGYLSQISTSVISSDKTIRNGSRNVQSTIQPISSSLYRAVKVHKNLSSNINAISGEINAFYPINVLSPNAYLTYVENVSRTFKMDNKSNAYYILNPSLWEVRK